MPTPRPCAVACTRLITPDINLTGAAASTLADDFSA
jgi:hypothetical protein